MQIEGQIAVVTGAASGLGEATARLLASRGATVALLDFNVEGAERIASELPTKTHVVVADLSDTITVLARGEVLAEGPYATVSKNPLVVEAYVGTGHG